ncbi:putative TIR domain, P-loop containing nucleoside triphosphate hydrolase [Rosa chinensis]|uniref:ADP-ribosyl cyclase/cyclic ADP-ribose hydrolase n=1 Tax=Rosa chinensis TaxID=74649 RepID=A0A2P6S740_ROSCH|nr:putative TIR domain, P-loop containing nucleoside triphosphate hydrolase [Rosa chinensis]
MAATSSCSAIIPREKYDVFLSFRGEDTRNTFTSHLYEALRRSKIQTYIDYDSERGDEIEPALLKAISESKLSVIIFSKNYASSGWCLEELVHILKCRDKQFVIPIFYGVDPSAVRKQFGSYADAFVEHEKRFKDSMDKVLRWRKALTTAANISGFDSQTIRPESDLVKIVVNDILAKLNCKLQIARGLEGLVGMEKHIQRVEFLLCLSSLDVQIVGIWGMGGIGKTTIAEVVFAHLSSQFEACCFIANVRESEAKHGLNDLWNQILRKLLKEGNLCMATSSVVSTFARERLRRTKALIVLDDVSEFSQLELLARGDCNLFGPGSRILVTTRNKRIFRNSVDNDKIYEVKELAYDEALELFHLIAFRNKSPPGDYTTFAKEVVDYAGGNPLALTILGSVIFCHCKSKEDWEGELVKLKKFPNKKIQNVLRFSYDGLEENEREIFLDIACYHKGKYIDEAKRILDACGFCANAGVKILVDMSLISVGKYSTLTMHDLIQEMGWEIVREKRSRLWLANDVRRVLTNNTGTEDIECMSMNMDLIKDLYVNVASFEKMHELRLLDLYSCSYTRGVNKLHLPPGFEFLPEALKYLRWNFYPLTSLPSRFSPENLVELDMRNSRLEQLWNKGMQINLGSIKRIDLSFSEHLADVSALIESPNLESINLWGCKSLVQLPSSFQNLAKLTFLSLYGCSNLKILPEMPGNLEVLGLSRTAIEELPSSIWSLEKLHDLDLELCKKLKNLPSSTCRLNSLPNICLDGCRSLESLPVELPSGLEYLELRNCKSLESLPVELPSGLEYLELRNCKSLGSLPVELPSGLEYLDLTNCKSLVLVSLPVELPSGLKRLDLRNCKSLGSLPTLPWLLELFDAQGCTALETVSSSMRTAPIQGRDQYVNHSEGFEELLFMNCVKLDQSARSNIMAYAQLRVMRIATASRLLNKRCRIKIVCPGNEIPKWMRYQSEGCSINIKLPPHSFHQGFLGYALCIVVAFNNYTPPDIGNYSYFGCEIHHKTNNSHEVCWEALHIPAILINSDHVFVWYFCPKFVRLESAINREDWIKASEASFDFKLYQNFIQTPKEGNLFDPSTVRVKRCGVSLLYAQETEKLLGGIDEDEVMEPKQAVEEEDIIIKTKRRRDESELSGSGTASFIEEYNDQLPPQSSKRKINIMSKIHVHMPFYVSQATGLRSLEGIKANSPERCLT